MKNLVGVSPSLPSTARVLAILVCALRLLTLFGGVMAMHLGIGPGSIAANDPVTYGSSVISREVVQPQVRSGTFADADLATAAAGYTAIHNAADNSAPQRTATTVADPSDRSKADQGFSSSFSCGLTCSSYHSMLSAVCIIALLIIGTATFLWLRSALVARKTLQPFLLLACCPHSKPQPVSLVQLSISRT